MARQHEPARDLAGDRLPLLLVSEVRLGQIAQAPCIKVLVRIRLGEGIAAATLPLRAGGGSLVLTLGHGLPQHEIPLALRVALPVTSLEHLLTILVHVCLLEGCAAEEPDRDHLE
eukprot:scaffold119215_cov50-Phaeocystis_antarctica.AAC.6